METIVFVTEFLSFINAWKAATATADMFAAFQGMQGKIDHIKSASRWFVSEDKELYYSYNTNDGIRIVTKAQVHSMLSDSSFQYIQIMVNPNVVLNPLHEGKLRFSGQYVNRSNAIECSKQSEAFAFNK